MHLHLLHKQFPLWENGNFGKKQALMLFKQINIEIYSELKLVIPEYSLFFIYPIFGDSFLLLKNDQYHNTKDPLSSTSEKLKRSLNYNQCVKFNYINILLVYSEV